MPEGAKLWASTTSVEPLGEIEFVTGAREHQKSRAVRQQLWAREVEIADGKRGKIKIHCVIAREVDAPPGVKPIEWRLLTNRVVQTQEQAVELINWYRARWDVDCQLRWPR